MDEIKKGGRGLDAMIPRKGSQDEPLTAEEMRKLVDRMDEMLGMLPEKVIEEFSKSEEFRLYERLIRKYKK